MSTAFVSIGSNIDKEIHIPSGLKDLQQTFGQLIQSSLYESQAIGYESDNYYNLIVQFDSQLDAKAVAKLLRNIEIKHGRPDNSQKFSARTLDLDLILYDDQIIDEQTLHIPRDEIEKYAFVLEPLAEIAPDQRHPISGKSYAQLWQEYDKTDLKQYKVAYPE